jgi:hypothetical protein
MTKEIYEPLAEYRDVFRERFKQVAEETFAELANEAHVDVEVNRTTCQKIYAYEQALSSVKSRLSQWKALGVFLILAAVGGLIALFQEIEIWGKVLLSVAVLMDIVYLLIKVNPLLKEMKSEKDKLSAMIHKLKDEAWKQMFPLNRLYDWDILTRMMAKTVPGLEFDSYFTTQRLADLRAVYHWDDSFNSERSVLYSHSGLINGNPFIICRTRKMEMGTKEYEGTKTIHWTTRERDSDGKYHTVQHSEVLRAYVTAPYPEYVEKTRLIYGNTAAPDLRFYRRQSGLAGKEGSLSFKLKKASLRRKARNLKNADFAMMTNEDFEVAFNTSNRNNNQQFALLFTPLAQENMLNLLKDKQVGYGDDFDFSKNLMINTIIPEHLQRIDLDFNPRKYHNFDYEKAKKDFYSINAEYFRSIYFSLAPLLCIPMYQQIRPQHEIYGHDMQKHSAFWEHEALANFWGQKYFQHPDCVTKCILKTSQTKMSEGKSTITVYAYGYRSEERLTNVRTLGRDGKYHNVPVYWDEYLPVTGKGTIYMKEDNEIENEDITQHERINHINNVLSESKLNVYRRHIASKI